MLEVSLLDLGVFLLVVATMIALLLIPFTMLTVDFKYANGRSGVAYKYPVVHGFLLCTFLLLVLAVFGICLYGVLGRIR
jgi:hypothetical protein